MVLKEGGGLEHCREGLDVIDSKVLYIFTYTVGIGTTHYLVLSTSTPLFAITYEGT